MLIIRHSSSSTMISTSLASSLSWNFSSSKKFIKSHHIIVTPLVKHLLPPSLPHPKTSRIYLTHLPSPHYKRRHVWMAPNNYFAKMWNSKRFSFLLCPNTFFFWTRYFWDTLFDIWNIGLVCSTNICRQLSVFPNSSIRICHITLENGMLYHMNNTFRNIRF